ncbi:MAG: acylphosphatase [Chloroflexota bacterium]
MTANPNEIVRLHVWVKGRVQGVGFRAFVMEAALATGVTGWTRNVGYDTVESVAEGPRTQVERFLQAVKTGPPASRVDRTLEEWEDSTGEFASFTVRRSM